MERILAVPRLLPRRKDAHKGDFGRVLIIGGSRGMIGAPALAANAALRGGAGLVTVACPESIQLSVATLCSCATSIPLGETTSGIISPRDALKELQSRGMIGGDNSPSVVAGGPGLGCGDGTFAAGLRQLWSAFGGAGVPIVLDADALNALRKSDGRNKQGWDRTSWTRTVITPHPGELARMHGTTTRLIQVDREAWAVRTSLAMASGASVSAERPVVVLKGAGTVVTDGRRVYVNKTGNPGMATGGSGDVLTGLIAALIGQGMACFEAAVLGVYLHGLAGDLGAKEFGQVSLTALDLVDFLPAAFLKVRRVSALR